MERRDFIQKLGLGAAFALTVSCFGGCKATTVTPASVDLTLNLDDAAYSTLKTNGSFVIVSGVVVAKTIDGQYVAATVICSHEQKSKVVYQKTSNEFYCSEHGARFDTKGKGMNSNGSAGLKTYTTSLNGNILTIK